MTLTKMRGLFRLAIDGLARVAKRGDFAPPESVRLAHKRFALSTDPIRSFIDEECVVEPGARDDAARLWASFDSYCLINGFLREKGEALAKRPPQARSTAQPAGNFRLDKPSAAGEPPLTTRRA
jgi:hypothetical protein